MPKKALLILLDGLGDRSYPEFQGQTPLQAAHTPTLDRLAAMGANGLYHAADIGQALPSENAHFALLGYDLRSFPGRGALEALGSGMDLNPGDVAVLAHFAALEAREQCLYLTQGKPRVSVAEAELLFEALPPWSIRGMDLAMVQTHGLFGVITIHGAVTPYFTDTDPFIDGRLLPELLPWEDYAQDAATCRTVAAFKEYLVGVYRHLDQLAYNQERRQKGWVAINGLVTQRAGRLKAVESFFDKYGLRGQIIASGLVYGGLARFLGLDFYRVEDHVDPGNDLAERLDMAGAQFEEFDFIHLHTKAPDAAAHTKDPIRKKETIEMLDQGLAQKITPFVDDPDMLIVITSDHSTPSAGPLIHSGETVPLLFVGQGVRCDHVRCFDEVSAAQGALGQLRGPETLYMILNHLERSKLHGVMDTPRDRAFWPGRYAGFRIN